MPPPPRPISARVARRGEGGAETIEFIGVLAMMLALLVVAVQAVALLRLQAAAEIDARGVARLAAECAPAHPPTLDAVDPSGAGGGVLRLRRDGGTVTAEVSLAPRPLAGVIALLQWRPTAAVTMAQEPACAGG